MEDFVFHVYCYPEVLYNGQDLAFFEISDLKKLRLLFLIYTYNSTMLRPEFQNEVIAYHI